MSARGALVQLAGGLAEGCVDADLLVDIEREVEIFDHVGEPEHHGLVASLQVAGAARVQVRSHAGEHLPDALAVQSRLETGVVKLAGGRADDAEHAVGHQLEPGCGTERTHVADITQRL